MRILLIAHDFHPAESPQALRWKYLTRVLAAQGHDVTVLCATQPGGIGERNVTPDSLVVAVAPEGLFSWLVRTGRRLRRGRSEAGSLNAPAMGQNWRGRLSERFKRLIAQLTFPDGSAAWLQPAERTLRVQLASHKPDLVITSHEPAAALLLWLRARDPSIPWIADLGDPVLSPYTLTQWRRRAFELEAETCRLADAIVVTTEATKHLLSQRHGATTAERITVIQQGFEAQAPLAAERKGNSSLRLLYAGRFYPFRDGRALFEAVAATPGVVLDIATASVTPTLERFLKVYPASFNLLGELSHEGALEQQRCSDVLVCIGNAGSVQTPGKVFEYLGGQRPVLYIRQSPDDTVGAWIEQIRRGWQCDNEPSAIADVLRDLVARRAEGRLEHNLDLGLESVSSHSWQARGELLVRLCERLAGLAESSRLDALGVG